MRAKRVIHVLRVMSQRPFPRVNFCDIHIRVMRVMHVIRVMNHTLFPLLIFVQSVMLLLRVMNVIRAMRTMNVISIISPTPFLQ